MRSARQFRRLLYLLVAFVSSFAQSPQPRPASLPSGSATVDQIKGEVTIRSPQGLSVTPQRGLLLEADTRIETQKGSMTLTLQDGSQVLIEPHSTVVLTSPEQNSGRYIQQFLGRIYAKVQKKLGVTPSFRMGTPTAIISVRGTEFGVSVNKQNQTTVDVYDGLVEVQSMGNFGSPVLVQPNFSTTVDQDEPPEQPKPLEHGPGGSAAGDRKDDDHRAWPGIGLGSGVNRNSEDSRESGGTTGAGKPGQPSQQEPPDD